MERWPALDLQVDIRSQRLVAAAAACGLGLMLVEDVAAAGAAHMVGHRLHTLRARWILICL